MKRAVALVMSLVLVLTSVWCFTVQAQTAYENNTIIIKGNVGSYVEGNTIRVAFKDEDGNTLYTSKFNTVMPDGSYSIKIEYEGDLTSLRIDINYADEDIKDKVTFAAAVTDIKKAGVTVSDSTAVVDIKDMFSYDDGAIVMVAAYDENNKLLDCKLVTDKTKSDTEAVVSVPSQTAQVKAYCWNSFSDILSYSEQFEGLLPRIDIFCHGDSYGAGYGGNFYPESGWGVHLGDYFTDRVTVRNYCTSGSWAQAIMSNTNDPKYQQNIKEGKEGKNGMHGWDDWLDMEKDPAFSEGDYVVVSLGLNDQKKTGPDGMSAVDWFGLALETMVERAEKKGVNLIICSPLLMASLKADATTKIFAAKAEEVAKKHEVPYINVLSALEKQYQSELRTDAEVMKKYYLHRETLMLPVEKGGFGMTEEELERHEQAALRKGGAGSNPHPNIKGADAMARHIAEGIKNTVPDLELYFGDAAPDLSKYYR